METTLKVYLDFLAQQFSIHIPHVRDGNQGADSLLRGSNPLWDSLKPASATLAAQRALSNSSEFHRLHKEYAAERPQVTFEQYVDSTLLDFALKLLRRAPALETETLIEALLNDFMHFLDAKRIECIEVAPLFNLRMEIPRIHLDATTQIRPLEGNTRVRLSECFSDPDIVFSRAMLNRVEFGMFRSFNIPIRSKTIGPPDDDIALDAELIFRILRPGHVINCGFSAYWSVGWHLTENAGYRLSSQFPWTGPSYMCTSSEIGELPELWQEIRHNISASNLRQKRFFYTARRRFVKAVESQAFDDRLLDLFITFEALLLRSTEKRDFTKKVARRLSVLLEPGDASKYNQLEKDCQHAYQQRHTVAHGIDSDLVGFDNTTSSFDNLVQTVDIWAGKAIRNMTSLICSHGSRDAAISFLDKNRQP